MPYDERWLRRYGVVMELIEPDQEVRQRIGQRSVIYYYFVKRCGNVAECGWLAEERLRMYERLM